jgi:hypothetical protein
VHLPSPNPSLVNSKPFGEQKRKIIDHYNGNTFHGQNSLVKLLFFQIVSNIYNRETINFLKNISRGKQRRT